MSGYIGFRKVPTVSSGSGVWTLNEVAKFKNDGIWPLSDPYFANVSLLLHGHGANNSTTITDSSANNHSLSRYGDTKISTTQSKFSGSSIYFDGSGDYLQTPVSTTFELGTSNFTIEFFAYIISTGTGYIFRADNGPSYSALMIYSDGSSLYFFATSNNSSWSIASSSFLAVSAVTNKWVHFAVVRNGSSFVVYIDGKSSSTATSSASIYQESNLFRINGGTVNCYIDELRITKGVARYTTGFTPPTLEFPNN